MNLEGFRVSLEDKDPPKGTSDLLKALWYDAKGDWERAHQIAQDDPSDEGAWLHAYLHRKEGDLSNAGYWYRRARRSPCTASLPEEWEEIARALLWDQPGTRSSPNRA